MPSGAGDGGGLLRAFVGADAGTPIDSPSCTDAGRRRSYAAQLTMAASTSTAMPQANPLPLAGRLGRWERGRSLLMSGQDHCFKTPGRA